MGYVGELSKYKKPATFRENAYDHTRLSGADNELAEDPSPAKGSTEGSAAPDLSGYISTDQYNKLLQMYKDLEGKIKAQGETGGTDPAEAYLKNVTDTANEALSSTKKSLLEKYSLAKDQAEASRSMQRQSASIANQKLLKYLPEQLKAEGLAGTGLSESSRIRAAAGHQNTLAGIDSNINNQLAALYGDYAAGVSAAEQQKANQLLAAYGTAAQMQYQASRDKVADEQWEKQFAYTKEQNADAKNKEASENVQATIDAMVVDGNFEEARAYAEANRDVLGVVYGNIMSDIEYDEGLYREQAAEALETAQEELRTLLADGKYDEALNYVKEHKADLGEQYGEVTKRIHDEMVIGGKESVKYRDVEYKLNYPVVDGHMYFDENYSNFNKLLSENGYDSRYDKDLPNGITFLVTLKHGPVSKTSMTYFNGRWYVSRSVK